MTEVARSCGTTARELVARAWGVIEQGHTAAARQPNPALTLDFWRLGRLVSKGVHASERVAFGDQIAISLRRQSSLAHLRALGRLNSADARRSTVASREQIELLEAHKGGGVVTEYSTTSPPKAELQAGSQQIHDATSDRVARREIEGSSEQEDAE